jgi:hypothetical protein
MRTCFMAEMSFKHCGDRSGHLDRGDPSPKRTALSFNYMKIAGTHRERGSM